MSRLADARERLADVLAGSGLRVAYGGRFAAPAILIEPAEPWLERTRLASRVESRWKLSAIAAPADTAAAYDELAGLIDSIDRALLSIRGVSLPTWGAPHDVTLGNVAHPISVGIVAIYTDSEV